MKIEEQLQEATCGEIQDSMNAVERGIKRLIDVLGALVGLILLSPIYLWICYRLKKQGDGPILFRQERIGYKGRPFLIYKFRTMRTDAEKAGPQLAIQHDDRLTPFGCFLREHHLDELPQLWNVLRGDMTMVGPRPERQCFIDEIMKYDQRYVYIYKMRPGLTSDATLYNGYTDTMEKMLERLRMDLRYLETRSLVGDFRIIWATFSSIALGKKI